MQPIQNATPRPAGEPPLVAPKPGESPLSSVQRTVLERLITRVVALNQQQAAGVWAGLKHDLDLKSDAPLLAKHFPAAEQNLNQRLSHAQNTVSNRLVISQLTELLPLGNNRQAVSDFIRQQFGQTALSQLTPEQLKTVLTLLQNHQLPQAPGLANNPLLPEMATPPLNTQPTENNVLADRPIQPAEQNILTQLVSKLAAVTGESGKQIWATLLEQVHIKPGEAIPARLFAPLANWLQAHQTLSQHPAPTLQTLQAAQKQPLSEPEREWLMDYSQQRFQAAPHTILSAVQIQDLLNQILLLRTERQPGGVIETRDIKPIVSPLFTSTMDAIKQLSTRTSVAMVALLVVILLLLIVV